jgi:outer membrane protein
MFRKSLIFLLVFIFSLLNTNLYAKTMYSLKDLCKIAKKNALKIKIAEDDLSISKLEKKRALSVLMPRLTAFGKKNKTFTKYDKQIPAIKMDNATDTETLGLKLDQSFTLNGKELIAFKVTKDQIKMNEYNLETTISNYMYEVSKAYFNILTANKILDISRSDVKRLTNHRNSVKEKLKVGTLTKTALFRAEAELSKSKTNFVRIKNNFKLAKAFLKNLVDIDEDFFLIENQDFNFDDFKISFDELVTQAINNRPELKSAEKILDIADKTIKYEKGAYWPKISIQGTYTDNKINSDHDTMYKLYDSKTNATIKTIEASFTFTLFDGGLRAAQIKQAIARKRQAKAALANTKNQIILESKRSWFEYKTAKSTLKTLEDELKFARENFDAVTMQFEYGLADSVSMMDADTLLVSAQRKLSEAEYAYILSTLDLIRIKGDLIKFML